MHKKGICDSMLTSKEDLLILKLLEIKLKSEFIWNSFTVLYSLVQVCCCHHLKGN